MAPRKIFTIMLFFILVQGGSAFKGIKMKTWERKTGKLETQLHKNRNFGKQRMWTFPTVCPPSPGEVILQWQKSKWDAYKTRIREHPLIYLRYVCGFTQVMKNVSTTKAESGENTMTQHVPLCCAGFIRDEDDICVPSCKGGCKHGVCLTPGNCICYEGYTENKLGHCVQTCPCGCPHGECYGDTCLCDAGYALDPETQTCAPLCQTPCVNGDCTAPNMCSCHSGYKRSNQSHVCIRHCDDCQNECGSTEDGTCVPVCEGCEHGTCVGTGDCRCHEGHVREDNVCVPVCRQKCINGYCAAPNHCECKRGYVRRTRNLCTYGCNPDCYNSDCVGLNQCECREGFYKRDPIKSPNICYPIVIGILEAASSNINKFNNRINI